jgi:hypothetical protein
VSREAPRVSLARWAWPAGCALAAVAFFLACLRLSGTQPVNSDGASDVLQAWQMLHGNLLLHGWVTTDVSFYTTELPEYVAVVAGAGLRPEVVHICAALTYTLLVLLAALVARGRARGAAGTVRALLAAGIMLAPEPGAAGLLLSSPDHVGTGVPVLLLMLLLDRAPWRWYTPAAAGALLAWALVGDPLILVVGVVPVVAVCLARAVLALTRRRVLARELSLGCAAALAVPAADAVSRRIVAVSGFTSYKNPVAVVPLSLLPANVPWTVRSILSLFGADVAGAGGGLDEAFALAHLAGVTLVAAAVALAAWRLVRSLAARWAPGAPGAPGTRGRPPDLVADLLVVAIVANIAAYFLLYRMFYLYDAHEIGPVASLGAALAGRLLGGPLLRARPRLVPALAAGLGCYAAMLGFAAAGGQAPPANSALTGWLSSHGLHSGLGGYWEASSVTLDSGGAITVGSVVNSGPWVSPFRWVADMRIFNPADHTADFFVAAPDGQVSASMAQAAFGRPARVYRYQAYTIMVWHRNLLRQLGPEAPVP